jgi:hypothetical protein
MQPRNAPPAVMEALTATERLRERIDEITGCRIRHLAVCVNGNVAILTGEALSYSDRLNAGDTALKYFSFVRNEIQAD